MNFSAALEAMKAGKKIRRPAYGDSFCYITYPENGEPIVWKSDCGAKKFYSHEILAEDWEIVKEMPEAIVQTKTEEYFLCPYVGCTGKYNYEFFKDKDIMKCSYCGKKFRIRK